MRSIKIIAAPFFFLFVFCNANPVSFYAPAAADKPDKPVKRALLIGINKYQFVTHLQGCVNDVLSMKSLLINKFEFAPDRIVTLLEAQAGRKAILDAFHQLIESTKTDDIVVIHYSGHGSQIPASQPDEIDTLDETIIPYDYHETEGGAFPILDKQLANFLSQLSKKTKNITIILDCCHSGGGTKDISDMNERMIAPDKRRAPASDDFLPAAKSVGPDKSSLKDDQSAYVLLAGCRSDQKSYELKVTPAEYHGLLTYCLVNELRQATEVTTWPGIMENIRSAVLKQHDNQSPQLEGLNKNSYVFGDAFALPQSYLILSPQAPGTVNIVGGSIYGITKGSVFKVYPPGTIDFRKDKIAEVMITTVSAFSSAAKVISGKVETDNCRAVESKHVFARNNLPVAFIGNWTGTFAALKANILSREGISEEKLSPGITFAKRKDSVFLYPGKDSSNALESAAIDNNTAAWLKEATAHWINWFQVANITNQGAKLPFEVSFDAARSIDLNKADFTYDDGQTVTITIKNKSDIPFFINVVDLQDNSEITSYPLTQLVDAAKNSNEPIPPGHSVSFKMQAAGRKNKAVTRDVIKFFASARDINFDFFNQRRVRDIGVKELRPVNDKLSDADSWSTIEKILFIKRPINSL